MLCDDFADEGLEFGWGWCDLEGFAEHGFGFVEEGGVFAEESDEGLAGFDACRLVWRASRCRRGR